MPFCGLATMRQAPLKREQNQITSIPATLFGYDARNDGDES